MNNFCFVVLQESDSDIEELELLDPSPPNAVVGKISVSCSVEVCNISFVFQIMVVSICVSFFLTFLWQLKTT